MARPGPLVFLDRDGVINQESETYIKHPDEWVPIPGSLEAIARATRAGCHLVVVTNQSGLARGLFDLDTLHAIHGRMVEALRQVGGRLDAIAFCPHHPDAGCTCRKPQPGLLEAVGMRLNVPLAKAWVVGDRPADLEAAAAVGARRILVRTGYGLGTEADLGSGAADVMVCDNLGAAVDRLLAAV